MIVQCDQCSSKFRLDDSKIKEGGAKVRCSKCKHIFIVQREAPAEESDFDSLLNGLVTPSSDMPGAPDQAKQPASGELSAEAAKSSEFEVPGSGEGGAGGFREKEGFDFSEFNFDAEPSSATTAFSEIESKGDFDFGELDLKVDGGGEREAKFSEKGEESYDDNAFSFPGRSELPAPEAEIGGLEEPPASGGPSGTAATSPLEDDDFTAVPPLEFSFEPEVAEPKVAPSVQEQVEEAEQPAPFDFGKFEFGEDVPSEKPTEGETLPQDQDQEKWEWEQPEAPVHEQIDKLPPSEMSIAADEFPPLSISSRRKSSSILPIAGIAISVLLVLTLAGGGFYFFKEGPSAFNKVGLGFMATWFGLEAKEEGGIAIRNTAGAFLKNNEAGEIFVINGEAVNNYVKPRASIQVKVMLYGPKGEKLLQKTIYCGNPLSTDQLTTLPVAKLEAAMGNQFGESLSNLAVQPGKGIPFVGVFTNVPKETTEFGVEVVGSTVASQ